MDASTLALAALDAADARDRDPNADKRCACCGRTTNHRCYDCGARVCTRCHIREDGETLCLTCACK